MAQFGQKSLFNPLSSSTNNKSFQGFGKLGGVKGGYRGEELSIFPDIQFLIGGTELNSTQIDLASFLQAEATEAAEAATPWCSIEVLGQQLGYNVHSLFLRRLQICFIFFPFALKRWGKRSTEHGKIVPRKRRGEISQKKLGAREERKRCPLTHVGRWEED